MPDTLRYAILTAAETAFSQYMGRADEKTTPDQARKIFLAFLVDNVNSLTPSLWREIAKEWK